MRVNIFFTPLGVTAADIAGKPVIVVDILRATTTIVTALVHGAKAVIPASASSRSAAGSPIGRATPPPRRPSPSRP